MNSDGYLIGYDIGSTLIKVSLLDIGTGELVASASSPENDMEIIIQEDGWAEQNPSVWWENVIRATNLLRVRTEKKLDDVRAIGISYQVHSLVVVDKHFEVLRPAILSYDNRACEIGEQAFISLGEDICLRRLLNSPGIFTASKLKWVMENEYDIYKRIYKFMSAGDYIGMMMTGEILTTPSALSEGILWDFSENNVAEIILKHYNISNELIPTVVPNFFDHGVLTAKAASELRLKPGIKVTYRAGDHLNNAFALNVLHHGEITVILGRPGVICGVTDKAITDFQGRVNTFLHVNQQRDLNRYCVLLRINGIGVLNNWLKRNIVTFGGDTLTYNQMNRLAELIPIGSEGLTVIPYGGGAEPTLGNKNIGAAICNLDFNIHSKAHILHAGQEGIAFALKFGLEIMSSIGLEVKNMRAFNSNIFLSPLFCEAFATVTGTAIKLYNGDGSQGAARGAGIGAGIYNSFDEACVGLKILRVIEPSLKKRETYLEAYLKWCNALSKLMNKYASPVMVEEKSPSHIIRY